MLVAATYTRFVSSAGSLDVTIELDFNSSAPDGISEKINDVVVNYVKNNGGKIGEFAVDVDSIRVGGWYSVFTHTHRCPCVIACVIRIKQ